MKVIHRIEGTYSFRWPLSSDFYSRYCYQRAYGYFEGCRRAWVAVQMLVKVKDSSDLED